MRCWIAAGTLALTACAPAADPSDDVSTDSVPDTTADVSHDGTPGDGSIDSVPDTTADVSHDGTPDDGSTDSVPDTTADVADDGTADDAAPPHPICRYECDGDDDCSAIYGAGWVCRALTPPASLLCLRLCSDDDDCRFGSASDPLMVCIDGTCGMRPCGDASECTWVNASAVCQTMTFGSIMTCQRPCDDETDCRSGAPTDVLWACRSGLCVWGCDNDDECVSAFSSADYGCRTPRTADGPSCYHACDVRDDCLTGGITDRMVDCR